MIKKVNSRYRCYIFDFVMRVENMYKSFSNDKYAVAIYYFNTRKYYIVYNLITDKFSFYKLY